MRRLSHAESRSELIEFIQVLGTMLDVGPYQSETFAGRDPQLGQVEGVRVAVAGAFHALMGGRPADLWVHAIKIDKALDKALAEAGTPRGRDRATQSKSFGIMAGILSTNVLSLTSIADEKEKKEADLSLIEEGSIKGNRAGEIATYLEPILAEVSPFEIHKAAERLGMSNEDIILATTYFMQAVSTGHLTNKLDLNLCQPFMRLLIEADVKFDPQQMLAASIRMGAVRRRPYLGGLRRGFCNSSSRSRSARCASSRRTASR